MDELELACFQIISAAGVAKSSYIEAIQEAKKGNIEKAKDCIKTGEASSTQGHDVHNRLLQEEASSTVLGTSLLLVHAEDQLMSAENLKIVSIELIEVYERLRVLENK
ncbi:PTS lactose/cellobiose transporter subunit IIA [Clostridium sp. OS1-26]|uniref:PTS lactose/cellobiose transporter subunit IIA n=1 Tax=Clostridium sp. OS1-26 TaxID=3070681 RepID=UPI0035A9369D